MRVLATNNISSVVSNNFDAEYPANNLLDLHPKKITKGTAGTTTTFTFDVTGAGNWFGLVNTNARVVTVKVYAVSSDEIVLESALLGDDDALFGDDDGYFVTNPVFEQVYSLGGVDTYMELITGEGQSAYELDSCYPYQPTDHTIVVEIDTATPGTVPHAGCATAGVEFKTKFDTMRGMQEGSVNYSLVKELSNGATYTKKRDKVRTFSISLLVERDREFYDLMYGVFDKIGVEPRLWKITDLANNDWVVFARLSSDPAATHAHADFSTIQFSLIEVL